MHAVRWLSNNEPLQKSELVSASKAPSYSVVSGSSTKSKKLRSQVRLKVATVAMEQESARGYETRLRARQRAEEKKKKILADSKRKQRELERKTRQEMERTLEEVDRELFEIEESAVENLRKKELEFEMARAEASAWNEVADIPAPEVQPNVNDMSARAIPIIEPDEVTGQADPHNVHTVHVPVEIPSTSIQTNQPADNLNYSNKLDSQSKQRKYTNVFSAPHSRVLPNVSQPACEGFRNVNNFNSTRVQVNSHLPGLSFFQNKPPVELTQNVSHSGGQQNLYQRHGQSSQQPYAHTSKRFNYAFPQPNANMLTQASPTAPVLSLRKNRSAPAVVIEKFDGDPMNYWLFAQQFEAHVLGNVEEYELFPLLYQSCESNVQLKISHLSNQHPSTSFRLAWDTLFDEYGHQHEIARCCEERLKNAPKVDDDDREKLKSLANLMEKCCIALEHIGQASSLDSMHVLMGIVNKLPVDIKRNWVEYSVGVERRSGQRAKFIDLSAFLTERSCVANSIFGRETFPSKTKTRWERAYVTSIAVNKKMQVEKILKCYLCSGSHRLAACKEFMKKSVEERIEFVRSKMLCFKCLGGKHIARECKSNIGCTKDGCTGTLHHTLLHKPPKLRVSERHSSSNDVAHSSSATNACSTVQTANSCQKKTSSSVFLNVVPVKVKYMNTVREIYAFLDQGSTSCFCDESLVKSLEAKGNKQQLTLRTLTTPQVLNTETVKLSVQNLNGGEWIDLPEVAVVPEIPVKPNTLPDPDVFKEHNYLRNIDFRDISVDTVQVLIGANVPQVFRVEEVRSSRFSNLPDAVRTPLGWSLLGPSFTSSLEKDKDVCFVSAHFGAEGNVNVMEASVMNSAIEEIPDADRELDNIICHGKGLSIEDRKMYELMLESIKFDDGHYVLPLPWRNKEVLPNNKTMALKRLKHLKKKLNKDPQLKARYTTEMQLMVDKGFAERVPENEDLKSNPKRWFISHHAVFNPKKPDKLRVVFDCATEYQGASLNKMLMQGPDLVNSLVAVLLRFRKDKIAIISDIEAMFYQVKVVPQHRDSLSFLWWPGGDLDKNPVTYRMMVHLFGATSSPSCATFALRQSAKDFGIEFEPYVGNAIENCFYVDDCLLSVPDSSTGITMVNNLRSLLSKAGFQLTKWLSNCTELMEGLPEDEWSKSCKIRALDDGRDERVLGVNWEFDSDVFTFVVDVPWKPRTKRGMLATMNAVFDPLGFITPIVLEAKLLYRNLCEKKLDWDESMPAEDLLR